METKKNQEQAVAIPQKVQALVAFTDIQSIAQAFFESGLFPGIQKQAQAVVKIVAGQELGLPPMFSMLNIDIITTQGRVSVRLNSQVLATLIQRSGRYNYRVKSHTDTECVLVFTDEGKDVYESRFSLSEAKQAGLVKPDSNWAKWPKAMLFARAMSQGAKIACPQLMAGASTLEDEGLEEVDGEITKAGEPLPSTWRAFWAEARDMGFDEEDVHAQLGFASMKDWLEQGHSLEEAIGEFQAIKAKEDIAALYGSERRAEVEAPVIPPAVEASEPLDDDSPISSELRETVLDAARRKIKEEKMKEADFDGLRAKLFGEPRRHDAVGTLTGAEGRKLLWAVEGWKPDAPK